MNSHKWILCRDVKIEGERALRCQFFTTNFDIKIEDEKAARRQFLPKIHVETSKLYGRKKHRDVPKSVTRQNFTKILCRDVEIVIGKKASGRPKKCRDVQKSVETSFFYQNFMSRRRNCDWEKSVETSNFYQKFTSRPQYCGWWNWARHQICGLKNSIEMANFFTNTIAAEKSVEMSILGQKFSLSRQIFWQKFMSKCKNLAEK